MRCFLLNIMCLALLAIGGAQSAFAKAPVNGAGFRRINAVDPVSSHTMDAVVFYPSLATANTTPIGPYDIDAVPDAEMAPGSHPVILISHGNGGSQWGHHDLASFLAQKGYIVVTLSHPGDNFQDSGGAGAASTLYGRSLQISAVLTAVLNAPFCAAHIRKNQIGFIGFSAGGAPD